MTRGIGLFLPIFFKKMSEVSSIDWGRMEKKMEFLFKRYRFAFWVIALAVPFFSNHSFGMAPAPATSKELRNMPELSKEYASVEDGIRFREGSIVLVFAHPDDELTVLSQVAQLKRAFPERAVHWILVTDAAKGMTLPGACGFKSKSQCRFDEAVRAARCMGISAPLGLGLPDGGLRKVEDLEGRIWSQVERLSPEGIAVIFTSDEAGLYGHADHLAVHDAVVPHAKSLGIPVVTGALTRLMSEKIPLREPALSEGRQRPEITHALNLGSGDQKRASCAAKAHRSQAILIWNFMQFENPRGILPQCSKGFSQYALRLAKE